MLCVTELLVGRYVKNGASESLTSLSDAFALICYLCGIKKKLMAYKKTNTLNNIIFCSG